MSSEPTITVARGLLQQIGLELAFAPSSGAATLRRLLDSLAESLPSDAPPDLRGMATAATGWLTGQATLSPEIAAYFNLWHPWMEEAVSAWSHGLPLPAAPAALPTAAAASQPAGDDAETQAVTVLPQGADEELMRLFCAEAEDLLRDIEQGVLTLEDAPGDADTLATVFRAFHTLKGNAAVMKLVVLQRLAHELESLLDAARRGTRPLTRSAIDVILAGADVFSRYVAEAARQLDGHDAGRSIPLPIPAVVARVRGVLSGAAAAPSPAPPADPLPVAPVVAAAVDEQPPGAPAPPPAAPALPPAADSPAPARVAAAHGGSIRVDTQKLDGLVDLVGDCIRGAGHSLGHNLWAVLHHVHVVDGEAERLGLVDDEHLLSRGQRLPSQRG
jgi:HPt (histidine-containing phosphotransfer) domain-containing protein